MQKIENKTKLRWGVKEPYKRKPVYENSMQFIREQIEKKIPKTLSDLTTRKLEN